MKLKFINLLLAAFLLIGSAQALTSCKDTDEDLYAQLRDDNLTLQKKFQENMDALQKQIDNLTKVTDGLQDQINILDKAIKDANYVKHSEFKDLVDKYIAEVSLYKNLKEVLDALKATQDEVNNAHGDYKSIGARFEAIELALKNLKETLNAYPKAEDLTKFIKDTNDFIKTTNDFIKNSNDKFESYDKDLEQIDKDLEQIDKDIEKLDKDLEQIDQSVQALNEFKEKWNDEVLQGIADDASSALAASTQNAADITALTKTYEELQALFIKYQGDTDKDIKALNDKIKELNDKMQTILDDYMTKTDVDDAIAEAIKGLATQDALDALAKALREEAQANLDEVELRLQQQIITCINRLNGLDTKVGEIKSDLDKAKDDIKANTAKIQKLIKKVRILSASLDNVIVRVLSLENRISSIQIQGVESPVLGYLKTPFGIESNFFLNYMGETDHYVEFPNYDLDYVEYDGQIIFTQKDKDVTGAVKDATTFASGEVLFYNADGNLGKIYLTINPANIKLDGKTFTVVTSQDKDTEITLANLRPSTVELTHGYSRTATSPNGFYEADVTVAVDKVPTLRVVVDNELKAAAKKVLKERNQSSLLALGNAVYNQFNGFLPALGICAAWEEKVGDADNNVVAKQQKVYSNYSLAAAAFKPLSYGFLKEGLPTNRRLHLPDISKFLDKYKFNFTSNGFDIDFGSVDLGNGASFNIQFTVPEITGLGSMNIVIEDFPTGVNEETGELITAEKTIPVNLDETDLPSAIHSALEQAMSGLDINEDLNSQINAMMHSIETQINAMLESMKVKVDGSLNEVLTNLQNQVNGKVDMIGNQLMNNALYSKLQAIVNRINGVLDNPNHYLQPVLLYSAQGTSYGMFSQSAVLPSVFTGTGNAVMLTPTTYTGEIVTPAFKKYVAVTNVWKNDQPTTSAQNGDAECIKLANAANAQPYMNEVVPGARRTIPFSYEGGQGYTYEIVYQALDYTGLTSTSKYYVSIQ